MALRQSVVPEPRTHDARSSTRTRSPRVVTKDDRSAIERALRIANDVTLAAPQIGVKSQRVNYFFTGDVALAVLTQAASFHSLNPHKLPDREITGFSRVPDSFREAVARGPLTGRELVTISFVPLNTKHGLPSHIERPQEFPIPLAANGSQIVMEQVRAPGARGLILANTPDEKVFAVAHPLDMLRTLTEALAASRTSYATTEGFRPTAQKEFVAFYEALNKMFPQRTLNLLVHEVLNGETKTLVKGSSPVLKGILGEVMRLDKELTEGRR